MRRTRPAPAGLPITLRRIPAAGAPGRARLLAPESLPANGTVPGRWFRCFCGPVGSRKQRIPADGSGNRRTTRNSPPSLEAKNEEGPLRRAFLLPAPELPLPALRAEHGCPAVRFRRFTFNAACRERNRVVRGSAIEPPDLPLLTGQLRRYRTPVAVGEAGVRSVHSCIGFAQEDPSGLAVAERVEQDRVADHAAVSNDDIAV